MTAAATSAADTEPTTDQAVVGIHADFQLLFDAQSHTYAARMPKERVNEILTSVGVDVILEEIAAGNLPVVVCYRLGTPHLAFRKWLRNNAPEEQLREAFSACAEACLMRATASLTIVPDSAQEASMVKAYADKLTSLAEKLDPDTWLPSRNTQQASASVVFNLPPSIPGVSQLLDVTPEGETKRQTTAPAAE